MDTVASSRFRRVGLAAMILGCIMGASPPAVASEDVWRALRGGGHVLLIRHAEAPGVGDPANFRLGDCSTQRNLSEAGRAQARAIGAAIREARVRVDQVLSSRWCRGLETAELMALGPVIPHPALDSFFRNRELEAQVVATLRDDVLQVGIRTVIMITHQVNVTALTGIYPASGEAVVVAPTGDGGIRVVGRLTVGPDFRPDSVEAARPAGRPLREK